MALTVRQAVEQYLDELEAVEGLRPQADMEALLGSEGHAPGASPTRANPHFPRKGAAGSAVADLWVYELQPLDLAGWGASAERAAHFVTWLWHQGYLGADRYEEFRELLELPEDDSVRLRRLEHRLIQAVQEQRHQPMAEHLLNPTLYLGLAGDYREAADTAEEAFGDLVLERVESDRLFGRMGDLPVGPVRIPADAAALARPGDTLYVSLGRERGEWRLLQIHPGF